VGLGCLRGRRSGLGRPAGDLVAASSWSLVLAAVATLADLSASAATAGPAQTSATPSNGAGSLLRDPGFLAIIVACAHCPGRHAAYYAFASITCGVPGPDGLTLPVVGLASRRDRGVRAVRAALLAVAGAAGGYRGSAGALLRSAVRRPSARGAAVVVQLCPMGFTFGLRRSASVGCWCVTCPPSDGARAVIFAAWRRHPSPPGSWVSVVYAGYGQTRLLRDGGDGA